VLRLTILLIVAALVSSGAPSDCTPGSLNDYLALDPIDGCRLGTRVVSGFFLEPLVTGANPIDPASVQITPSSAGLTGSLLFTYNTSALDGELLESILQFTVAPDGAAVEKVDLQLIGASATGDGVVTGIADMCSDFIGGGVCFGVPQGTLIALVSELDSIPLASGIVGPLASYNVLHDIVIDGGLTGTASLTSDRLIFTAIPEPATLATLATGLLVTFVLKRRRRNH
jgi:hypothetical protein